MSQSEAVDQVFEALFDRWNNLGAEGDETPFRTTGADGSESLGVDVCTVLPGGLSRGLNLEILIIPAPIEEPETLWRYTITDKFVSPKPIEEGEVQANWAWWRTDGNPVYRIEEFIKDTESRVGAY